MVRTTRALAAAPVAATLIATLLGGCSGSAGSAPDGQASAQGQSSSGTAMQSNSMMRAAQPVGERLDFTLSTVNGKPFDGRSLNGKPTVLWFWAAWCSVCAKEAPSIAKVAAANPGVTFVGVSALGEQPAMQKFVTDRGVGGFTNLNDKDATIWRRFGVNAQPAQAFIGRDGTVEVVPGPLNDQQLATRVAALAKP
jgi:peroxiredoxin